MRRSAILKSLLIECLYFPGVIVHRLLVINFKLVAMIEQGLLISTLVEKSEEIATAVELRYQIFILKGDYLTRFPNGDGWDIARARNFPKSIARCFDHN